MKNILPPLFSHQHWHLNRPEAICMLPNWAYFGHPEKGTMPLQSWGVDGHEYKCNTKTKVQLAFIIGHILGALENTNTNVHCTI